MLIGDPTSPGHSGGCVVESSRLVRCSSSDNERDQAVVVNASGVLDGSAAVFLANIRDGEALIVGGDTRGFAAQKLN
jgi:hypothetical protein